MELNMGKASRKVKHGAKMARKRAVKAARRSEYAAMAGTSKKAKRQGKRGGPTGHKHAHVMSDCGNPGCQRCYPRKGPKFHGAILRRAA